MKLIDKDALVAWAKETYLCENASMIRRVCYKQLLEHLDTIEVKEVEEDPVSEDLEEALAKEWKGYNDRGAATVDALEDNTQELTFAKGFYRGAEWGKNQTMAEIQAQSIAFAHGCPKESINTSCN